MVVLVYTMMGHLEEVNAQETRHMELPYRILEELQRGTYVGNVFKDAGVGTRYTESQLAHVEFRFLSRPELGFTIEQDTGILRTGPPIDRDEICAHQTMCTIQLDVVAVIPDPLRFLEIIKVNVEILDRNDNAPRFPEPRLSYQVLESAMPGSSFVIPTAIDPDSGDFGIQRYELLSNTDKFELDAKPKVDGSTEVRLVTRARLDREIQDYYQMKIFAYDGGTPSKSGSVDVMVTVNDVNDNDPVFSNTTYEVSIIENTPPQNTIVRVHANDHDIGLNGQVIYGFSPTTEAAYGKLFGIRNSTGEIYVKGTIDYEKNPIYHLSVTAHDLSPDSRTADATVIIKVRDANDNAPQITVNTLAATGTSLAEIAEDADLDTFVAHITVTDPDSGRNGQFICSLNDNHFTLTQMYQSEYKIVTRAYLDRETRDEYNLAIACRDRGLDPQVAIKHITVRVTDINDNSPLFRRTQYQASLIENNFVGAFIAHVNATDADAGSNGAIRYDVEPNYQKLFKVDHSTGVVSAAVMFDHEEIQQIKFRVIASDKADKPRTSVATITVDIEDVNDERPQFSQKGYSFGVMENQNAGKEVGVVHAIDRDAPPFNQFEFSFFPSPDAIDKFVINPKSGAISTKVVLDREEDSVYYLTVQAIDKGTPPKTSSVIVSVYVSDTNDNVPVFDFPSKTNNTIHISNMVPVGYVVTRVRAYDRDIGQNSNLTYQVIKGSGRELFSVDHTSGNVAVISDKLRKIDFEAFDLQIQVRDHGEPYRKAKTMLNIMVNHTIAFNTGRGGFLLGHNLMIVVIVSCVTGVIVVLLIIAILALRRSGRNEKNGKYNCPKKALTLLSTNDPPKEAEDNCRNKGFEKERNNKQFIMNNRYEQTHVDLVDGCDANEDDKSTPIPSPPPPPQVRAQLYHNCLQDQLANF